MIFVVDCCVTWLLTALGMALAPGAAFCLELQAQPIAPSAFGSVSFHQSKIIFQNNFLEHHGWLLAQRAKMIY